MRRLYLLRHAKSSWDAPNLEDHDRPLAPRGQRAGRAMAAVVRHLAPRPDLVLCSTAARARETLDLVRGSLGAGVPVRIEGALYAFDPHAVRRCLAQVDDAAGSVLVVGHNPALECLAAELAPEDTGDPARRLRRKFPTAALATLDVPAARWQDLTGPHASARIVAFTRPADVESMSAA
ncbi:SixA phosphatase family protein [Roseospira marina]|nr:histidine phosphatase family protein [Roseospira marina]MBB4313381.1 phosphohistidine phosphatase [Roseospira marina]MBB5085878.1 phosphohistidine phosphatase [Roseospira marina]